MIDAARPPLTFAFFPEVPSFEVLSDDVADGAVLSQAQVADFMGYSGENKSPQLSWSGFPAVTKSFALTVHDPDAPTGSGFWHWIVVNIPVEVTSLVTGAGSGESDQLPDGVTAVAKRCGNDGLRGRRPATRGPRAPLRAHGPRARRRAAGRRRQFERRRCGLQPSLSRDRARTDRPRLWIVTSNERDRRHCGRSHTRGREGPPLALDPLGEGAGRLHS